MMTMAAADLLRFVGDRRFGITTYRTDRGKKPKPTRRRPSCKPVKTK
jgi:hypothetical protein